jgi:hypothetical protein
MSQVNSLGLYMISNQVILCVMCLVRSWNMGFLANLSAKVLSTRREVEFTCFSQGCWERGAGAGSAYFQKSPRAGAFRELFLYNT